MGEVGELSEIFQWRGDAVARGLPGFSSDDKRHVGEEMSDVRLSHQHNVLQCPNKTLPDAAMCFQIPHLPSVYSTRFLALFYVLDRSQYGDVFPALCQVIHMAEHSTLLLAVPTCLVIV